MISFDESKYEKDLEITVKKFKVNPWNVILVSRINEYISKHDVEIRGIDNYIILLMKEDTLEKICTAVDLLDEISTKMCDCCSIEFDWIEDVYNFAKQLMRKEKRTLRSTNPMDYVLRTSYSGYLKKFEMKLQEFHQNERCQKMFIHDIILFLEVFHDFIFYHIDYY